LCDGVFANSGSAEVYRDKVLTYWAHVSLINKWSSETSEEFMATVQKENKGTEFFSQAPCLFRRRPYYCSRLWMYPMLKILESIIQTTSNL